MGAWQFENQPRIWKRIIGLGLCCQLLHSPSLLSICHQDLCAISWLVSAGSDSFPKSVPWLGWQAGSVLQVLLKLPSDICPLEGARLGTALRPSRLLCPSEVKGIGLWRSKGWGYLGFLLQWRGNEQGGGFKLKQIPGFSNKTLWKHFKGTKLYYWGIMTLTDAHFPNCKISLN